MRRLALLVILLSTALTKADPRPIAHDEAEIRARLTERIDVSYEHIPLKAAFEDLRTRLGINIHVFWHELELLGVFPERPWSANLRDVPAGVYLDLLLATCTPNAELRSQIRGNIILVATRNYFDTRLVQRLYDVNTLLGRSPLRRGELAALVTLADTETRERLRAPEEVDEQLFIDRQHALVELLTQSCEPDAWIYTGAGPSTIQPLRGVLFVNAPEHVHRQLEHLLNVTAYAWGTRPPITYIVPE